ncbi:MAG TPA: hypothetical protein VJ733_05730, partial [Candidatus Binatia bacterium]|nr:hypothetical protein [Candidatus Binatia bacterium]
MIFIVSLLELSLPLVEGSITHLYASRAEKKDSKRRENRPLRGRFLTVRNFYPLRYLFTLSG